MTNKTIIAPSILSADFANMAQAAENISAWGGDCVHFDVMDGHFVPTITFGPAMCKAIRKHTELPIDVHLMVERPQEFIRPFADAGADIITFHVEAEKHIHRTLQLIKQTGCRAGVVLNPASPIELAEYVLDSCDLVLLMTVNPGAGGQKFISGVLKKIEKLSQIRTACGLTFDIEVDGGINPETAALCRQAGANMLVAGNSVFSSADPAETIRLMRGI